MKIFFLISLAVVIAAVSAKKDGRRRKSKKPICGSNGVQYNGVCEFFTAVKETCGTENVLHRVTMSKCKTNDLSSNPKNEVKEEKKKEKLQKNVQICANDGKTYSKCEFMAVKHCQKLKTVHYGKCGECTVDNVCGGQSNTDGPQTKKQKKRSRKLKKRGRALGGKICTADTEFDGKCNFAVAKCQRFADTKEILKSIKCKS